MNEKDESKLLRTVQSGVDLWNDSCSQEELKYAINNGAVGATTNPVIVLNVLKQELNLWEDRIKAMVQEMPNATEDDITWKLIEEMAVKGSKILYPIFKQENGKKGRISIQTNAKYYRDANKMVEQAVYFSRLAPNIQVKIPATKAGIEAIEEVTYLGVNINATVCFTVPQSIAVAEAVERGLIRRKAEELPTNEMTPVCTIMVGRTDDWIKKASNDKGILLNPECYEWAGVAAAKKAYRIYKERGYKTKMLFGALRNHYHWSEFIGGDLVLTIPHKWQVLINACDVSVENRIDIPVREELIDPMLHVCPEFRKTYNEDGMTIDEFESYGATQRTLSQFLNGYDQLVSLIRGFMLPTAD